jgi:hypothetical protein
MNKHQEPNLFHSNIMLYEVKFSITFMNSYEKSINKLMIFFNLFIKRKL